VYFSIPRVRKLASALLLVVALSACATAPPVQEMSDARQAIAAAREAGAEEHAAGQLSEAETRLHSAEDYLQSRRYWDARREAVGAKDKAIEALLTSRALRSTPSGGQ
jgi:hypothetical protein